MARQQLEQLRGQLMQGQSGQPGMPGMDQRQDQRPDQRQDQQGIPDRPGTYL
jgi:hypothetical protein